jgi:plastocyanin
VLALFSPVEHDLMARQNGTINGKIEMPPMPPALNKQVPQRYGSYSATETSSRETKELFPEVANVVVYLEGAGLDKVQRDEHRAVLDQRDATFFPHVLPIVKGTTVRIVNRDKTYHNVFSLSPTKKFNIGRRPTGEEAPVTFDKTGTVQVFCDIHSHMSAFILVLNNPMFVQPKADGTFTLDDVPPGKYTMQAWHERFSSVPQSVTVAPGQTVTVNFVLQ